MKLLLHICCGPCASATLGFWRGRGAEVKGFFHNPNIQPYLEYRRRLTGVRDLAEITRLELVEDPAYDPQDWFATVSGTTRSRCSACIGLRLQRAAAEAVASGCDAFSTTLAISPWQDHDAIRAEGEHAGAAAGVTFLYKDLRPLYAESRRLSRTWGLYRQKYCGCIVSEWERFRDPRKAGEPCS